MILPLASCKATSTPPVTTYSVYQLEYLIFARYPDFFWCDPDYYPVGSEELEKKNALEQFPAISANTTEFKAILEYLGIQSKSTYSDEEILRIYREHKKLTGAIQINSSGTDRYEFSICVGSGQGYLINGVITASGAITESTRKTSINTCPICLSRGTLIANPRGNIPIENILPGDLVWSQDKQGNTITVRVERISRTRVPDDFRLLEITLTDGRELIASPSHPSASGKPLGAFLPGDILDGSVILSIISIPYAYPETFDILPAGPSGLYRANGILLMSTLQPN
ncbi:MAG: Hint domain-containing protein [Dehalococcoidales bacterium]|nr:Hint domain-containing protein [Dehalococcoidales bacterium]